MNSQTFKKLDSWMNGLPNKRPTGYLEQIPAEDESVDSERGGSEDDQLIKEAPSLLLKAQKRQWSRFYWSLIFHLGVMAVYTSIFFTVLQPRMRCTDARSQIVHCMY